VSSSAARRENLARSSRRKPGEPPSPRAEKARNETLEWIKSFGSAILLFLVIRTFLVQAFSIPSSSMENTLLVGDYLMANNAVFGAHIPFTNSRLPAFREPRHGDIVVFRPTYNDPVIDVVKRVIGAPGDTVQMIARVMYRNGRKLEEPYVKPSTLPDAPMEYSGWGGYAWHLDRLPTGTDRTRYRPTRDSWGPLVVPAEHFFLMGDNRDESLDSRFMGPIPRDVIRGKPMFLYFSYDPHSAQPFPRALTAARWSRIGNLLR
jgi:signal peptidase I